MGSGLWAEEAETCRVVLNCARDEAVAMADAHHVDPRVCRRLVRPCCKRLCKYDMCICMFVIILWTINP